MVFTNQIQYLVNGRFNLRILVVVMTQYDYAFSSFF